MAWPLLRGQNSLALPAEVKKTSQPMEEMYPHRTVKGGRESKRAKIIHNLIIILWMIDTWLNMLLDVNASKVARPYSFMWDKLHFHMVLKSRKFIGRASTITKTSTIIAGRDLSKYLPIELFHMPKLPLLSSSAIFPTCFHAQNKCFFPEIQI